MKHFPSRAPSEGGKKRIGAQNRGKLFSEWRAADFC